MTHAFTRDPVDIDLDRELARIEAENRRDEALDDEANAFMLRSPDAEFGRVMRQAAIRNDDLYALMFDAAREIAEKNLETPDERFEETLSTGACGMGVRPLLRVYRCDDSVYDGSVQMSKHTPGPWVVRDGGTGYINQIGIDPSIGCAYGAGEEVAANARLIAAAPEMLNALRRAALALAFGAENFPAMSDDYQAVSAAIEKATGESK